MLSSFSPKSLFQHYCLPSRRCENAKKCRDAMALRTINRRKKKEILRLKVSLWNKNLKHSTTIAVTRLKIYYLDRSHGRVHDELIILLNAFLPPSQGDRSKFNQSINQSISQSIMLFNKNQEEHWKIKKKDKGTQVAYFVCSEQSCLRAVHSR